MDFTFRTIYQRHTSCSNGSQSSNYTYFSQQAHQCDMESYNGGRYDQFHVNRDVMLERQLEKEMIRREILEEEAARRRELEAEVRRELRMERELELREFELRLRGSDQWEPTTRGRYVGLFEKRVALPFQKRMYDFPRIEEKKIGGYEEDELLFQRALQPIKAEVKTSSDVVMAEELPFQRALQPIKAEVKTSSDVVKAEELPFQRALQPIKTKVKTPLDVVKAEEKKKIISLAKPDANHSGKKRKEMASPVEGPSEVRKKLTNEWSCALCRISATSELGLEDHLKGKKHKSKQAGQNTGMIGLCSEKINKPLDPSQVAERSVESEKSQQTSNKYETRVENKKGCGGAVQKMPKNKIMKFKFYCEMCEVGAFSEKIMNSHKKGKKHLLRLDQLGAEI